MYPWLALAGEYAKAHSAVVNGEGHVARAGGLHVHAEYRTNHLTVDPVRVVHAVGVLTFDLGNVVGREDDVVVVNGEAHGVDSTNLKARACRIDQEINMLISFCDCVVNQGDGQGDRIGVGWNRYARTRG